ncbi:MAG: Tn3 family transposase [Solirubrobacteraceae bacterium]
MARLLELELEELVDYFTLTPDELGLLRNKAGATRLGFGVLLKFVQWRGRFPAGRGELPENAIGHVARQVGVADAKIGRYDFDGRQIKAHRAEIRRELGLRECTVADAEQLTVWLAGNICERERNADVVRDELLARCRACGIEPPARTRAERIVASALRRGEDALFARVAFHPARGVLTRVETLIGAADDDELEDVDGMSVFAAIRADPGGVSLNTMLVEVEKLLAVRAVGLPAGMFADIAPKILAAWRGRAAAEAPSHLRAHPTATRMTLVSAPLWAREREITDTLVDLLISTVHRINARAEKKIVAEFIKDFERVTGKERMLFRIAEAAIERPGDAVREVIYPVAGGEDTLQRLVAEYRSSGSTYRRHKQKVLKASYTNHYRRGLIALLGVLEFRSSNTAHRPVIEALALVKRHANRTGPFYPVGEQVPIDGVVREDWRELVLETDSRGRERVVRGAYEIAVFEALRERLRCKEIWVLGADRWRNPDEDLLADFETRRVEHYAALSQPLDPAAFIDGLRGEMEEGLAALNTALPGLEWLEIAARKSGAIRLTPADALPEPRNLRRLKAAILKRWGNVQLIDMLKEAVLRTGCLSTLSSIGVREAIDRQVLEERLILLIYAYGTNTGIRSVAAGEHRHSEDDLRYARRRYLALDSAREVARALANATFAARKREIWGESSTAVASDSTHVPAFDQNIFTEWHSRYHGRGVLIYWHVEEGAMAVHSQLIKCSASEVAAMIEGAVRHGTEMDLDGNYVDSHGQSEIGFGITRLLGFKLLPRIKRINHAGFYLPGRDQRAAYPLLEAALHRPIRWEYIAQEYDQMMKYATAIRVGTASTEAILRRFTRNATHPSYRAMLEVGRAEKTIFLARYLRDRDLQQDTESALNIVEHWNGANDIICFGKRGEIATNQRDEQELVVICLHILQASLVYINTLMIQDLLADPEWAAILTDEDRRGLTPLFWLHMLPWGPGARSS